MTCITCFFLNTKWTGSSSAAKCWQVDCQVNSKSAWLETFAPAGRWLSSRDESASLKTSAPVRRWLSSRDESASLETSAPVGRWLSSRDESASLERVWALVSLRIFNGSYLHRQPREGPHTHVCRMQSITVVRIMVKVSGGIIEMLNI